MATGRGEGLGRSLLRRLRGEPVEFHPRRLRAAAAAIGSREGALAGLSDAALRERAAAVRAGLASDDDDALAPPVLDWFAVVREVARRALGERAFDEQLCGGLALVEGAVAQLQTGEGKTLAAVFAASRLGVGGRGVHVLTANDYLARRDAEWMGVVYARLGLRVAAVSERSDAAERRAAYAADVTYGSATEIGFDHLRDRLCRVPDDVVQRPLAAAIVDEADSILIDEARIPLVVAGGSEAPAFGGPALAAFVRTLREGEDYACDEARRNASLTDAGTVRAQRWLDCENLYAPESRGPLAALNLALHAEALLTRDVDYLVRDGKLELIDEFKGRVAERRRWPHGLQAALEAKEGLRRTREGRILGTLPLQALIELYPHWSGMTATAEPAAAEFHGLYGKHVVIVPPHRECIRVDRPDVVYARRAARDSAVVAEVASVHATGRPVLVGTASVSASEQLASKLAECRVPCRVLNARQDDVEAEVIAEAGALGAVTISTNMAGRGTDIRLGGATESERDAVVALGGLYIIGTNRHDSVRVDLQLRGRAGRQGDPGESRFFVSLEDPLIERYRVRDSLPSPYRTGDQEGPIEDDRVRRRIAQAQRIVEGQHAALRKSLIDHTLGNEALRRELHDWRQDVLFGQVRNPLEEEAPERHAALRERLGNARLEEIERVLWLSQFDRAWANHLERVDELREGIHFLKGLRELGGVGLTGFGKESPLVQFRRGEIESFEQLHHELETGALESFQSPEIEAPDFTLDEALAAPASMWTYVAGDDTVDAKPVRVGGGVWQRLWDRVGKRHQNSAGSA